ncbi:cation diffusion facilitator family transporter [Gimesia sp.]|uniref:cation diffusion facilitator family transporter n=1 Tax=Gimesia sp. TaxID=2024833 RepID=UPI000C417E35|nr:cation diffusion facilitator family transporter [Gimesia sp.]MAX38902.1 cation transporter [Gimesia sp.]HBL45038.1 cation transporter [Planctomycetaceae bacterium]
MKASPAFEFPPEQDEALHRARRLEWITIIYLISVSVVMYLVLGSSQAMKTAWIDDLLSLIAPIVFLTATRIAIWEPNERFPYGYHRIVSIAFLCAALALSVMGGWLLTNALIHLFKAEHPTIGGIHLFGHTFWLGWLMIPALVYSAVPAMFLGRAKLPLARKMHDKVLFADANMNKADWLTALAALIGVVGIGLGYWWADAVASALISLDILHDGIRHLREVVCDLMQEAPRTVERSKLDPLPDRVAAYLRSLPWVEDVQVRMREEGHVYFGEAFIVPREASVTPEQLYQATRGCTNLNWRVHDFVLVPVPSLDVENKKD